KRCMITLVAHHGKRNCFNSHFIPLFFSCFSLFFLFLEYTAKYVQISIFTRMRHMSKWSWLQIPPSTPSLVSLVLTTPLMRWSSLEFDCGQDSSSLKSSST